MAVLYSRRVPNCIDLMLSDKTKKIKKKKSLQKVKTSAIAIGKQRHVLASFPKCQAVPGKMCVAIVNRWLPVKTT